MRGWTSPGEVDPNCIGGSVRIDSYAIAALKHEVDINSCKYLLRLSEKVAELES